jgi:hypothetical protein
VAVPVKAVPDTGVAEKVVDEQFKAEIEAVAEDETTESSCLQLMAINVANKIALAIVILNFISLMGFD